MNANALQVLRPYKDQGSWVFDDPSVGLVREPFVFGIDEMIERMVALVPNAEKGFRPLFATQPFPGHAVKIEWRREEAGGNWYFSIPSASKGGSVPRSSSISTWPLRNFTRKQSR